MEKLFGIDISHWQGDMSIDYACILNGKVELAVS